MKALKEFDYNSKSGIIRRRSRFTNFAGKRQVFIANLPIGARFVSSSALVIKQKQR